MLSGSPSEARPIAMAAGIAAGTLGYGPSPAAASPVRFDTDAGIQDRWLTYHSYPFALWWGAGASLDITRSLDDQPGIDLYDTGVLQLRRTVWGGNADDDFESDRSFVAAADQASDFRVTAAAFAKGQAIGPGAGFTDSGERLMLAFYRSQSEEPYHTFASVFPADGSASYIGARFYVDGELHFGWLGFRFTPWGTRVDGSFHADLVSWGYETEPGVGIAAGIPAPTPVALLAVGAAGALGLRERCA